MKLSSKKKEKTENKEKVDVQPEQKEETIVLRNIIKSPLTSFPYIQKIKTILLASVINKPMLSMSLRKKN